MRFTGIVARTSRASNVAAAEPVTHVCRRAQRWPDEHTAEQLQSLPAGEERRNHLQAIVVAASAEHTHYLGSVRGRNCLPAFGLGCGLLLRLPKHLQTRTYGMSVVACGWPPERMDKWWQARLTKGPWGKKQLRSDTTCAVALSTELRKRWRVYVVQKCNHGRLRGRRAFEKPASSR